MLGTIDTKPNTSPSTTSVQHRAPSIRRHLLQQQHTHTHQRDRNTCLQDPGRGRPHRNGRLEDLGDAFADLNSITVSITTRSQVHGLIVRTFFLLAASTLTERPFLWRRVPGRSQALKSPYPTSRNFSKVAQRFWIAH